MEYKKITIEITMDIPKSDCLAIEEIGDEIAPILEPLGTFIDIRYHDNEIE